MALIPRILALGLAVLMHTTCSMVAICKNWDSITCGNQTDGGCKCVSENASASCSKGTDCGGFGITGSNQTTTITTTILTRTMVDILGQSGKFTVYDERRGKASGIQVTMDALREVDASGNSVGASGSVRHSIQTFAAQNFEIAPGEDVTLGDDNVSAVKVSFASSVSSIGLIRVDTYVLGKSGALGPPGETWAVQAGDLKWNIELSNWTWCVCKQGQQTEEGAFIDLDISVKGFADVEAKGGNKSLSLGGGVTLELSNQVYADGTWASMPEGYPKISLKGSSTTFTFRFPKFTTSSLYDPVRTGLSAGEDARTASTSTATGLSSIFMPAMFFTAVAFLLSFS